MLPCSLLVASSQAQDHGVSCKQCLTPSRPTETDVDRSVTPAFSAELAPPDLRGLMVGLNGINIALGYALASYMGLAFFYQDDPVSQWRSPLGIALVWPVMMIVIALLVPESPRFLLLRGRNDEAHAITLKLHALKSDPNNDFAEAEFYQMAQQAAIDRKLDPGWLELFRRPSYRKRCMLAMTFAFIGQSSGVLVVSVDVSCMQSLVADVHIVEQLWTDNLCHTGLRHRVPTHLPMWLDLCRHRIQCRRSSHCMSAEAFWLHQTPDFPQTLKFSYMKHH